MNKVLEILKQRRIWAGICAMVALGLRAFVPDLDFDAESATNAIMAFVQAIADLGAVFLPLWSYIKPKVNA